MTMARAKRAALWGSTAASAAPSRRCRCQSSGRVIRRLVTLRLLQRAEQILPQQQLEREAHSKAGDVSADVRQAAGARGGGQIHMRPGGVGGHEVRQKARREYVIALTLHRALHDVGHLALDVRVEVLLEGEVPHALAADASGLEECGHQARAV